jgi:hypothetical protein
MGEIAANLMSGAKNEDLTLSFAVFHLAEMLMSLEKEYDARWHGERSKRVPWKGTVLERVQVPSGKGRSGR